MCPRARYEREPAGSSARAPANGGQHRARRLKPGDRAALVAFSHVISANQTLTDDLDRVRAGLFQNRDEGLTSLIDAAHAAMLIGESDVGRSLLIVFSDGVDTSSWLPAESVIETARRGDVVVYGVEVGERPRSFRGARRRHRRKLSP